MDRFRTAASFLRPLAALYVLVGVGLASPARAEQIVLFDITYTHDNSRDSHHQVAGAALNQPDDWTSPINYAEGTMYFYHEVMTKPSDKSTIIDFCFISGNGYGCIETLPYTTTGRFDTERPMSTGGHWYQRNQISFGQRMSSIEMVLKDPVDYINGGDPQSDYLPSMMRFVATLVSPGGTYVPPVPSPGFEPDAGVPPDAGDPSDAGVPPDAAAPDPDATPPVQDPPSEPPPPVDDPEPSPPLGGGGSGGTAAGSSGSGNVAGSPSSTPATPSPAKATSGCSIVVGSEERRNPSPMVVFLTLGLVLLRRRLSA